jgi:hypothetical protein
MKKELKYNPTLSFIRKDISGNLLLDGEFVFDTKKDKLPIEHLLKWVTTGNPQRKEKNQILSRLLCCTILLFYNLVKRKLFGLDILLFIFI